LWMCPEKKKNKIHIIFPQVLAGFPPLSSPLPSLE